MRYDDLPASADWKRDLVLLAKNTHVWLSQLSLKYKKRITRIDQIPDKELGDISSQGFNGLWLVGIWQRSPASRKIKQLYGREKAIASAYSIYEYRVADDLGGDKALESLKLKANKHSIQLACDMVPNHTGLDSPWIFQHPERYISTQKSPREGFSYNSPNLSSDPAADIFLDEGYYTQTGAAEVFKYAPKSGDPIFIYHGNDGTSMPWNDTAQLNYLNADTRRAVREEIIAVARKFKIIRLDAAMTLVRKHFKRLWFPFIGGKKYIPTRENDNMTNAEFDRLMPDEFWKEVVIDLAEKAPDTLLIAEAFWLMEKYFVNELGMHRVYNSAFMHQLRDEENIEFRCYLQDILQTSPLMLDCFVNFLTTPDEDTAINQFGASEKYIGACRLLACLPGLPMFGHGQWEGLSERYGMDISHPMLAEDPRPEVIHLHQEFITPLLKKRSWFAAVDHFRLFNFIKADGQVDEDVIALGNCRDGNVSLVLFNNSSRPSHGTIHSSIKQVDPHSTSGPKKSISLHEWLRKNGMDAVKIQACEIPQGNTLTIPMKDLQENGMNFNLKPYESHVFEIRMA